MVTKWDIETKDWIPQTNTHTLTGYTVIFIEIQRGEGERDGEKNTLTVFFFV